MSSLSTAKMTSEQYSILGEDPPGIHLELAHGEIVVTLTQTPAHSELIINLVVALGPHIRKHKLGRLFSHTDTVFDNFNTRRPDIIFFSRARRHLVGEKSLNGPPDLCVEVLSPFNQSMDRKDKFDLYRDHGVANYWIVDPMNRTVDAFVLANQDFVLAVKAGGDEITHLPPFPDLAIPLAEVWPEC